LYCGAMEPVASSLSMDTCCRWYPALDGAAASATAATGFVVVMMVVAATALALRACALLDGGLL
jgi:hypothetical protein